MGLHKHAFLGYIDVAGRTSAPGVFPYSLMSELKTYSDQIIDYIKQALLRGDLVPGDKVNEVHLASALSISRAPVREALQMLVTEGLVVSIPQRGKFITSLTSKDIRDSYRMGGVLEGAAISASVANYSEQDFARLENLLKEMTTLDETGADYAEEFARLDVAFHETLLAKSENKLMIAKARDVCQRLSKFLLYRYWPRAFTHAEVVERHGRILDAVRSGSPERIERVIRNHYDELGERMCRFGKDVASSGNCPT